MAMTATVWYREEDGTFGTQVVCAAQNGQLGDIADAIPGAARMVFHATGDVCVKMRGEWVFLPRPSTYTGRRPDHA